MVKQSAEAAGLERKARVRQSKVEKQKQYKTVPLRGISEVSAEPAEIEGYANEAVKRLCSATMSG